jgi:parallel beta-helix repeat protein
MTKLYLVSTLMLISAMAGFGQVITNSGSGLAPTYPDLNAAITALNGATISSPVVITLAGNETAPPGGYTITAQGTAANTIIIEGSSSTVTASGTQAFGSLSDAIFKLVGADFVTLRNFAMQENAANSLTTAVSNNMTEWGVALLYATTTNGAQNCTIQNNAISLNRTYANTFGIYSNSTHAAATPTTTATAITAAGGNSRLRIYNNIISNVNNGIVVVGPTAAADHNDVVDIGGTAAATGNTVTDFGNTGTFSSYANISATVNGILVRNARSINVSHNNIASAIGFNGVVSGTLRGICVPSFSNVPTGTYTNSFNNNTLALSSHVLAGVINGITIESSTSTPTATTLINNNNFTTLEHTIIAASGNITAILLAGGAGGPLNNAINGNRFTNLLATTTGSFTFISNDWTRPANASTNVNNNSIVGSFSKTGSGGIVSFYNSNGLSTNTGSEINTGNNFSNVTVTGSTTLAGWQCTDGSATLPFGPSKTVTNNTFTNITAGTGNITLLFVGYSNSNAPSSSVIAGNMINTVSGAGSVTGITSAAGGQIFTGNTIYGLSTTGASVVNGINISGGSSQTLSKHKIYDLSGSNAAATVNGIVISSSSLATVANNLIGDLRTPAANGVNPLVGINITGGTIINVHYNTVLLAATSSGTNFGSSALSANTAATLTLRNNILVNNSTPNGTGLAVAYRRSSATLTTYATASNNNLFYAGTPGTNNLIYADGTNGDQTLAAYKARVVARDVASVTENPHFLSITGSAANFLHINPAIATQIESGGTPISNVTDDFDGDARNAATPDIGADEFTGIPFDLTGPGISYAPLGNTACLTNITRSAVAIVDGSGVNTTAGTRPRMYFKKLTQANTFNDNTNATDGWKYVEANGTGGSPFSFTINYTLLFGGSGVAVGDTIQYFVVAQDLAATPNLSINNGAFAAAPSSVNLTAAAFPIGGAINRYAIVNSLSGTVTIGAAGTYPTLTGTGGLFEAINSSSLSANLTADIIDASITEPGTVALNAISYTGCISLQSFSLTIKPASGVTSVLTGSVGTGALIKLNGADNVTIYGSNSGGSSRDLTIRNTTATTSGNAVIWLAAPGIDNGATNNRISSCIIEGNSAATTFMGLFIGGNTSIGLTSAGLAVNSNNTIVNNLFRRTQYGIYLYGSSTATPDATNTIASNQLGTAATGEGFSLEGIHAERQIFLSIGNNEVQNVRSASTINLYGIRLLDVRGSTCNANKVHDVVYNGTGTTKNYGIAMVNSAYTTAGNASNSLVSNNFVYAINSSAVSAVWNTAGILASAGFNDQYYHNTVNMSGQLNNSTSGFSAAFANGDNNITAPANNVDVRNNIFYLTGSSVGGSVWAYFSTATGFAGSTQSHNLLRCAGTGAANNIGSFNNTNYNTLSAWRAASGLDANSVDFTPVFVSATDLHLVPAANALIDNLGFGSVLVTRDIDEESRNPFAPDMGADEFAATNCVGAVGGSGSGNVFGCLSFSGTITASGYSTGVGATYQWVSSPNPTGPWTAISGATNPASYTVSPTITVTTYYKLAVACATNASVDSSTVIAITIVPRPTAPIAPSGPLTICAPNAQVLDGSGTNAATPAFVWLRNNTPISGATGATFAATTTGAYRVRVTDGITGCFDTSAVVILNVNPQPTGVTATATADTACAGTTVNLTSTSAVGYSMNPAGSEPFIDIDANTTVTTIASPTLTDDSEHNINMPRFTFNGITYTTARVAMNGGIALGSTSGDVFVSNTALPTSASSISAGSVLLLPWWDDLDLTTTSPATTIKMDTVGSKFIIQYTNTAHDGFLTGTIKFQVQMDTANGQVHFVYNDVAFGDPLFDNGRSATVGIQWSATSALQYSFNTASLTTGQCISFTPVTPNYSWTGPNGFTSNLQNPVLSNVAAADSGVYTVTVTNPSTGCTNTATARVTVIGSALAEWIGAVDSDWSNTGNWRCGTVPATTSNVVIRSGVPNYPVIAQNVEIRSLTVRTGATVTVNTGFELKLNGN